MSREEYASSLGAFVGAVGSAVDRWGFAVRCQQGSRVTRLQISMRDTRCENFVGKRTHAWFRTAKYTCYRNRISGISDIRKETLEIDVRLRTQCVTTNPGYSRLESDCQHEEAPRPPTTPAINFS